MLPVEYIEVILPLPLATTFTYSLPEAARGTVSPGSRVIVPFGKRKFYTGIVAGFTNAAPRAYEVKEVLCVLDARPVLRHPQLRFWEWMSDYYLCAIGDVYKAGIPSGLKIESETEFEINPDYEADDVALLNEREVMIYQIIASKGKKSANELEKDTGFRNTSQLLQRMIDKGALILSESLTDKYRPKIEKRVRIAFERHDEQALRNAFDSVKGARKQEQMLLTLIHLTGFNHGTAPLTEVTQQELLDKSQCTSQTLKSLIDKGIVERYTQEISRFGSTVAEVKQLPTLTPDQASALNLIHSSFKSNGVTLLHGVTSSGKTEVYAHLADFVLKGGDSVLYLVPEIALTTQLTQRLKAYFGARLLVYHSKFTDNERVEIWNKLLHSNEPYIVVGARSSVFLPFSKLGLVIVDEEHDQSYKQFDPAPRYNGRDAAIMLAHMHGGKTLLGSATPSVETYYKAMSHKYGLVTLSRRFNDALLPAIEIIDMAREYDKKAVQGSLSNTLIAGVRNAVKDNHQAILFHNRRGFAPVARCTKCQFVPKCAQCDVSLTYHKRADALICHYCGSSYPLPTECPVCKEPAIQVEGYGTERIEDEVEQIFAQEAKVARMDLDTTRNKNSYANIIDQFSSGRSDILVGTQMVTKGLDFKGVTIVGVINADKVINHPDFRSAEYAFNMLEQVSGRAGRSDTPGTVYVQTRTPEHEILKHVKAHDYVAFYDHEIEERRLFSYPPFTRLIYIYLKHKDEKELDNLASLYGTQMRQIFGTRVQGPAKPSVARVQNLHIRIIMLKIELNASPSKVRELLRQLYVQVKSSVPAARSLILYYDVDPY